MPYTTIILEIVKPTDGYPPAPVISNPPDPREKVPWRMAQFKRSDLPNPGRRGVGHRPKRQGYFYRFSGGNATFGIANGGLTNDGDFEFDLNRGNRTIRIEFDPSIPTDSYFHSISLTVPLLQTNSLGPGVTFIELNNDTNNDLITSGQIGMVVHYNGNPDVKLYVDPDWDNRR